MEMATGRVSATSRCPSRLRSAPSRCVALTKAKEQPSCALSTALADRTVELLTTATAATISAVWALSPRTLELRRPSPRTLAGSIAWAICLPVSFASLVQNAPVLDTSGTTICPRMTGADSRSTSLPPPAFGSVTSAAPSPAASATKLIAAENAPMVIVDSFVPGPLSCLFVIELNY